VLELHPDNGSEFFNHHLLRLWKDIVKGVKISRSRPFHKNDNRFVEQKNATLVRAYLEPIRKIDSTVYWGPTTSAGGEMRWLLRIWA
jgi:hypothetical protein